MGTQSSPLSPSYNGRVVKDDLNDQFYTTDTSNVKRVIEGVLPDGHYGLRLQDSSGVGVAQFSQFSDGNTHLKIAKSGVEVTTASSSQLVFDSNQDIFRIVGVYQVNFSFTTGSGFTVENINIPHSLGYAPLVVPYVTNLVMNPFVTTPVTTQLPYTVYAGSSGVSGIVMNCYMAYTGATTTNLTFQAGIYTGSGQSCSGTVKAYVIQETIS